MARLFGSDNSALSAAFDEAFTAYTDGDFEKARRLLLPLAGVATLRRRACCLRCTNWGKVVPQDNTVRRDGFVLAAERSNFPGFNGCGS